MPSSSETRLERGLDAMVLVYALLDGHPASGDCEAFIRQRTGWWTPALTLLEVNAVLTKVYGVPPAQVTQKLVQAASAPLTVLPVEVPIVMAALATADRLQMDLTDAVLLETARAQKAAFVATDDQSLAESCRRQGITPEEPRIMRMIHPASGLVIEKELDPTKAVASQKAELVQIFEAALTRAEAVFAL